MDEDMDEYRDDTVEVAEQAELMQLDTSLPLEPSHQSDGAGHALVEVQAEEKHE